MVWRIYVFTFSHRQFLLSSELMSSYELCLPFPSELFFANLEIHGEIKTMRVPCMRILNIQFSSASIGFDSSKRGSDQNPRRNLTIQSTKYGREAWHPQGIPSIVPIWLFFRLLSYLVIEIRFKILVYAAISYICITLHSVGVIWAYIRSRLLGEKWKYCNTPSIFCPWFDI